MKSSSNVSNHLKTVEVVPSADEQPTIYHKTGDIDRKTLKLSSCYSTLNGIIINGLAKIRINVGKVWFTVRSFKLVSPNEVEADIEAPGVLENSIQIHFEPGTVMTAIYPAATDSDFLL